MAAFNKVILIGNLTRDPQVKYLANSTAVCEIGLAVNRKWQDKNSKDWKEEVTFVDVTLWGKTAEVAGNYLTKGRQVLIEGRLQLDTWDDKTSGQKRSKLRVVGEGLTMLGTKPNSPYPESSGDSNSGPSAPSDSTGDSTGASPEDVPF